MKRKNLHLVTILAIALFIISVQSSFSQWTVAGALSNLGSTNPSPSVSVVDQNTAWVVGGELTPTIYRTTNGGTNWLSVPTAGITLNLYCVWAIDANTAFVADGGNAGGTTGGDAKFFKTTNAGLNWTVAGNTGGTAGFFNGIVFSKTDPNFGVAQSDPPTGTGQPYYLAKTSNGGNNWTVTNPPGVPGSASALNSIFVVNSQIYGFGSNATGTIILTTDGGTTWNARATGAAGTFNSGAAFKDNGLIGLSATSTSLPSIARTTNGGTNWSAVNVGTNCTGYCTIKWIEGTNTCYISANAGSAGVVKKSTDAGLTWTTMTTSGLTGITHMEFKRSGTTVYGYAVTANGAMLKVTDVVTEVSAVNSIVPSEYSLEQNYPNPFNPTTTINFSIPKSSIVSLKVYDALGKEVATLVNEFKNAGNYSADFTATSNLTSGIYFYTLTSENFTSTKKFMLVK